jgi:arylsulfatase A-like enzyme
MNPDLPLRTPVLDQLASMGTRFTQAICPSPVCAPCRAALATGKAYDNCAVKHNGQDMPDGERTFYQILSESGYQVGGCGKFDLRKSAMSWGNSGQHPTEGGDVFDMWGFTHGLDSCGKHDGMNAYRQKKPEPYFHFLKQQGLDKVHFDDYNKRPYSNSYEYTEPTPLPDHAYADNWVGQHGLDIINGFERSRPWFIQVNFPGPHEPMDVTESMRKRWEDVDNFPQPYKCTKFGAEKHLKIRRRYAAMIENIDIWLGKYVQAIQERGELENTIIIFSSDHGEMLGDHDLWMKTYPHQYSIGVPFVIAGPGVKQQVIEAPTNILDINGTCLELARAGKPEDWDTESLVSVLRGQATGNREIVTSGLGTWRVAFDGRYKLSVGYDYEKRPKVKAREKRADGPVYLFDLSKDAMEETNIAEDYPEIVARLSRAL